MPRDRRIHLWLVEMQNGITALWFYVFFICSLLLPDGLAAVANACAPALVLGGFTPEK